MVAPAWDKHWACGPKTTVPDAEARTAQSQCVRHVYAEG